MVAEKTAGGQSNPTYVLQAASGRYVLRRKPGGVLLPSAHAIEREHRVMAALAGSGVPVPRMLHLCADPGVCGTAFFVMAHVTGLTFDDPALPGLDPARRRAVYDAMNRALAALARVDPVALGLGDFGKSEGFHARQLRRWTAQYRAAETGRLAEVEDLIAWLEANPPPPEGPAGLVHGDWRIDNLIFDAQTLEVAAVLDWELSTLGPPAFDLACQIMQWRMPPGERTRGLAGLDRAVLGLPGDAAYAGLWAERAGRAVPDLRWTVALAAFRMAAILQGVGRRALDGNASNPGRARRLGETVPLYAQAGLAWVAA